MSTDKPVGGHAVPPEYLLGTPEFGAPPPPPPTSALASSLSNSALAPPPPPEALPFDGPAMLAPGVAPPPLPPTPPASASNPFAVPQPVPGLGIPVSGPVPHEAGRPPVMGPTGFGAPHIPTPPGFGAPPGIAGPATFGGPGYAPYMMPGSQQTCGLAVAAMVCGIIGFLGAWAIIGGIPGIVAVILGAVALGRIKNQGLRGRGMAITGIVMGALAIAGMIGMIILVATLPADSSTTTTTTTTSALAALSVF